MARNPISLAKAQVSEAGAVSVVEESQVSMVILQVSGEGTVSVVAVSWPGAVSEGTCCFCYLCGTVEYFCSENWICLMFIFLFLIRRDFLTVIEASGENVVVELEYVKDGEDTGRSNGCIRGEGVSDIHGGQKCSGATVLCI